MVFGWKETGAKVVTMATAVRVQFVSYVMDIYGAKFQEHCFNISRDIAYSDFTTIQLQYYDIITNLICIIEKRQYLLNEKRYFRKKNAILLYFERPFK